VRRWLGVLAWAAVVVYFVAGAAFLVLRHGVLPQVDRWRADVAAQASAVLGLPVRIGRLEADWSGLRPRLHLRQVEVADRQGATALTLAQVDATFAWSSLLRWQPYFHRLEIFRPSLQVARDAGGRITVAGIDVGSGGDDGAGLAWLLEQRQFVIVDATLTWTDAMRAAPALVLSELNLRVLRRFGRHEAGLTARPGGALASRLDLRADVNAGSGTLAALSGRLFAHLDDLSVEALAPWVDLPGGLAGGGDLDLWATLAGGAVITASAELDLADARVQLDESVPALDLRRIHGRVAGSRHAEGFALRLDGLALESAAGVQVAPTDLSLSIRSTGEGRSGELAANQLDLAALAALAAHLPVDAAERARLAALAPRGALSDVAVRWQSDGERLQKWSARVRFDDIGVAPQRGVPGLRGISGELDGDQDAGRYRLGGNQAAVEMPGVFTDPLSFDHLVAEGGWQREAAGLRVRLDAAAFANADLDGEASGSYVLTPEGPGEIDLQARLDEADGTAVWRYLPQVVNEDTRSWLKRGIVAGRAHDARLRLKGDLADFPFTDGSGIFLITARVSKALLDFAPGWPNIDRIEGGLRFDGPRMTITASQGVISGTTLKDVVADVPDLANGDEQMTITGQALGATSDFLRFIGDSPVRERIGGFTDGMQAVGDGRLELKLEMPLRHVVDTAVTGRYRFSGNMLRITPDVPPISEAAGRVEFTASSLSIPEAQGTALGGPLRLSARTDKDGTVRFAANGEATAAALRQAYGWRALDHLSGQTGWQLEAAMRRDDAQLSVSSALEGIASSLPAPFNKSSATSLPTQVMLRFKADAPTGVEATLGTLASARLTVPPAGSSAAMRGGIGVGTAPRPAGEGITLSWKQPLLDLDAWLQAIGGGGAGQGAAPTLSALTVDTDVLRVRRRSFHEVSLQARLADARWVAQLRSREAEGRLEWTPAGDGRVVARLSRLMLGEAEGDEAPAEPDTDPGSLPALDVVAERFGLHGLDLGRLEVQAVNRDGVWQLNDLQVSNPSSTLKGSGTWTARSPSRTRLKFELEASDVGRLLKRLDYPDAVRGGTARLGGQLSWRGGPADLDFPTLDGDMNLLAESGQFRKLDPGVGRLLGVLSLQSLPRRITLDFRDIFSEGFAFDRISGSIGVKAGVLRTDPLEIRGPAARIFMRGQASVPDETQDLLVTVQPTLSESVAVGAALGGAAINPVAGVVTYIVQKALEDPVEKFFAFEYAVTGTWNDPVVEKMGKRKLPEAGGAAEPKAQEQ
jgi:uncharacterized protein (TIGR02099 family)